MVSQSKLLIRKKNISWDKDGKDGPTDPITSVHVIMKFMTTPGNIIKYRNGTNGKSKEHCHQMLSAEMMRAGTMKHRQTKDVRKKTSDYEDTSKSTHALATFNDTVTKKLSIAWIYMPFELM